MWLDTFQTIYRKGYTLESRFLSDRVPLYKKGVERLTSSILERTSSVLASKLPVFLNANEKRRLLFFVPHATQSLGQYITVSILLADFVHRFDPLIPKNEQGALINGDILLITQNIQECVNLLRNLSVDKELISRYWDIEVLSQYSVSTDNKPRVFIANPGWLSSIKIDDKFFMVIIDGSHPRTLGNIDKLLLNSNITSSNIQIFILPPYESEYIERLQKDEDTMQYIWMWDPYTINDLEISLFPQKTTENMDLKRYIWISRDNSINNLLFELHTHLVEAMRICNGNLPGRLLEAWSVYHRLRQLTVPLVLLEEKRSQLFKTLTIKERIELLEADPPNGYGIQSLYFDIQWPKILELIKDLYIHLLKYKEPAKFYTLALAIVKLLKQKESYPIRIVAPTSSECDILSTLLGEIVDDWNDALQAGNVTLTNIREEPKLIAVGQNITTILLGFRTSDTRYLDIYPPSPIHVISYPYESEIDNAIQQRLYSSIEKYQDDELRANTLQRLHLPISGLIDDANNKERKYKQNIRTVIMDDSADGTKELPKERAFFNDNAIEPFSIERFAGLNWTDEIVVDINQGNDNKNYNYKEPEFIEITLLSGERIRYATTRQIEVYYKATNVKERLSASELKCGMQIILLVDDPYDDLFSRLLETMNAQRDLCESMLLNLWQHAKKAALAKAGGSRQKLYTMLSKQGLSVDYYAVVSWYSHGENEIIAPLMLSDFELLAKLSGLYTDFNLIKLTFSIIQKERVIRRYYGKRLNKLLLQIADGQNYEIAIKSAKIIGTPLEQIAAAVSLKQVEGVRLLGTLSDIID